MKLGQSHLKLLAVAASCVAIGAAISAIASAGAATTAAAHGTKAAGAHRRGNAQRGNARGVRHVVRRAVHAELVVGTKSGFAKVTFDRGSVQAVSGQQLTLREGTKKHTYKTVTLTIPTSARVRINHKAATLSQLSTGQRVLVFQLPKRTVVSAHNGKTP